MSDLAFNMNGEPFDLQPNTSALRVRKLKPKGAPEVVYGRDGLPLFLPADADIEDVRREVPSDGRYRLDQVDEQNRTIPNAQSAYVCVHPIERAPEPAPPAPPPAVAPADITAALVAALLESQKQHTELARMYVSQFPVVANAMAGVVRSASDAGLTARVPLVLPAAVPETKPDDAAQRDETSDDDDQDNDNASEISNETDGQPAAGQVAPQPEYSWARVGQTLADQVAPHVGPLLAGLPGLAAMLGAKRAATASDATRGPDRADPAPAEGAASVSSGAAAGLGGAMLVRLNAILAQLTPVERQFAQVLLDEIPADELPMWLETLRAMSVDEAVAYVREKFREGQAAAASARPAEPPATEPTAAPRSTPPPASPTAPSTTRREGRRSTTSPTPDHEAPAAAIAAQRSMRRAAPSNGLALLDEGTQSHLAAIDAALTLEEAAALRKQFAALSPRERASWVATLVVLPVADAVAAIRAQLAAADVSVPAASPASANGSETPDAPVASVAAGRALSAPPSRRDASSAGANESAAGDAMPASTHDVPAPSTLITAPLAEQASALTDPAQVVINRDADMHLAEVERGLTPDERVRMHAMFSKQSPDEREAWLDGLLSVAPAQGTAMLREALEPATTATVLPDPAGPAIPSLQGAAAQDDTAAVDDAAEPNEAPAIAPGAESLTADADAGKHLATIMGALTLAEKMRAHELAAQRPTAELRRWYADLLRLSVPDAVAKIRAELARSDGDPHVTKKGDVL